MPSLALLLLVCLFPTLLHTALAADSVDLSSSPFSVLKKVPTSVIIVGGGPVGLATALTLARPPHDCNVTVLEKSEEAFGPAMYDATRAYLYNVNPRGLVWLNRMEESYQLTANKDETPLHKLMARGSSPQGGFGKIVYVSADPDIPIDDHKARQTSIAPVAAKGMGSRRSYWIPRHQMVELLQESCRAHRTEQGGSITLLQAKSVTWLSTDNEDTVTVHCADGSSYTANLVVGADGVDSMVRNCLATSQDDAPSSWLHPGTRFQVKRYKSPSTGLNLKVLQFPPNFTLPKTRNETLQTESETMYIILGRYNGPQNSIRLGFLPTKDSTLVRAGNVHTRPDHELRQLQTGAQVKAWFVKAFPRLDWDDLIPNPQEWERFAQANGTTYPYCQYSPGSAVWNGKNAGVVLVGDACHAYPPDIGQGINSGLLDVVALDQALQGKQIHHDPFASSMASYESPSVTTTTLEQALERYQANRSPEHRALIRFARFGSPYQYKQPWIRDRIGRFFWMLNVVLRMILGKLTGGLVPPGAMILAYSRHDLTFRQVMQRADTTALVLKSLAAVVVGLWLKRFLPI